jgi:hypothetical protein
LLAFGTNRLGAAFQRVTAVEWYVRRVTGAVILAIGVYITLHHVWGVVP